MEAAATNGGDAIMATYSLTLARAIRLVADDMRQNAGSEDMSDAEAVAYALDTVYLPEDGPIPGAAEWNDYGDECSAAYRMVLSATDADIDAALHASR